MRNEIINLIKTLKDGIEMLEKEQESEFIKGQIDMARCVVSALQKIVLGLK